MEIEYEATFLNINKDIIRKKLKEAGAKLKKPEFLQKRVNFDPPKEISGGWVRIRDESDKITMSLKIIDGNKIENQRESCVQIDNFEQAEKLLIGLGCEKKAYQETKRELWLLDNVEITIDEWPFLEPFVEVEGKSEAEVKTVSEKLGFDYSKAYFGGVTDLYAKKYNLSNYKINNETPIITFEKNPFQ